MQRLEVSGAVRPIYGSLGVKRLSTDHRDSRSSGMYIFSTKKIFPLCPGPVYDRYYFTNVH